MRRTLLMLVAAQAMACEMHFDRAVAEDARTVYSMIEGAQRALITAFPETDVTTLLSTTDCHVYVHQTPTEDATVAKATTRSGGTPDGYRAEIHVLALSSHPSSARTAAGQPKDVEYMRKLVTHEYSSILLDRLTRSRAGGGWRFYSAPAWFVQGYEEYLAIIYSSLHNKTVLLPRYREMVRSGSTSRYAAGAARIAFLHDHFGRQRVQRILTNPASSFDEAFRAELQSDWSGLESAWQEWLAITSADAAITLSGHQRQIQPTQ